MTGTLRIVGAGLPRTGTASLKIALERLLGGQCCHMSAIPGHPFDLGVHWRAALAGGAPAWDEALDGCVASVDWPASAFWRDISAACPEAPVLLSTRDSAEVWLQSLEATVLPVARGPVSRDTAQGNDLVRLLERFTGTSSWDDPDGLRSAYERHNAEVRRLVPPARLVDWHPGDGWGPICQSLGLPIPAEAFPWVNKRQDWG